MNGEEAWLVGLTELLVFFVWLAWFVVREDRKKGPEAGK